MIDSRHLRYFVALAEELHFGRAAANVGVAQPALSQQIRKIEDELGVMLFERRPVVALTQAGQALLVHAREALAGLDVALAAARRGAQGESGSLSIGFAASAVLTRFPRVVRQFRQRFPDVTLELRELPPEFETDTVARRRVDVAFVRETPQDERLIYERVEQERLVALLPRAHRLASAKTLRLEELAEEPVIHFPREISPTLYDQIQQAWRSAGAQPRVVQEVREWMTEISLVQAGLGVAVVPSSLHRLRLGGVSFRELKGRLPRPSISICYRASGLSPVASRFVESVLSASA